MEIAALFWFLAVVLPLIGGLVTWQIGKLEKALRSDLTALKGRIEALENERLGRFRDER